MVLREYLSSMAGIENRGEDTESNTRKCSGKLPSACRLLGMLLSKKRDCRLKRKLVCKAQSNNQRKQVAMESSATWKLSEH